MNRRASVATPIYCDESPADKTPDKVLDLLAAQPFHLDVLASDLISPDWQTALLTAIEVHGYASLDDCIAAIEPHERPVAALIAPAEAGRIAFDSSMPFDRHLRVRRAR
jgi:hypothetical protein